MKPRRRSSMGKLAKETARETDITLKDEEVALLARTSIDWEELRPKVADKETYDRLIAAVNASTQKNESMAALKDRLKDLGEKGLAVTSKVISLLK